MDGLEAAVEASAEAESADIRLATALKSVGDSSAESLKSLQDQASAFQQLTGVSDEAIKIGQSLLISMGHLRGEGLEKATQAALDLSVKTGSVESAFDLLAKAAAGNTTMLGRYGIVLDENLPKAEKFEAAVR